MHEKWYWFPPKCLHIDLDEFFRQYRAVICYSAVTILCFAVIQQTHNEWNVSVLVSLNVSFSSVRMQDASNLFNRTERLTIPTKYVYNRNLWNPILGPIIRSHLDDAHLKELWTLASGSQENGILITTTISAGYLPVLENWIKSLHMLNISSGYLVMCIDQVSYDWVTERGIPAIQMHTSDSSSRAEIWYLRTVYIAALTAHNLTIIQSDVDAIWMQDVRKFVKNAPYSVIFSRGQFPENIFRKLGFTACMGWTAWKSSLVAHLLLRDTVLEMQKDLNTNIEPDDQIAANRALYTVVESAGFTTVKKRVVVARVNTMQMAHQRGFIITKWNGSVTAQIAVLPFSMIRRQCGMVSTLIGQNNALVLHCLTPKNGRQKEDQLRQLALWYL